MIAQVTSTTITSTTTAVTVIVDTPFDWLGMTISLILGVATVGVAAWAIRTTKDTAREQTLIQGLQYSLELKQTDIANAQQVNSFHLQRLEEKQHGIEKQRHDWQRQGRDSASLEVSRHDVSTTSGRSGGVDHRTRRYVRIRNTGQSEALDVPWELDHDDPADVVPGQVPRRFDFIHPGEHVDLLLMEPRQDSPQFVTFRLTWRDASQTERRHSVRELNRD